MRHTQRLFLGGNQRRFIPEKTEIDGSILLGVQQQAVCRRPDASAAERGTESTAGLSIGTNRNAGMQCVGILTVRRRSKKLPAIYSGISDSRILWGGRTSLKIMQVWCKPFVFYSFEMRWRWVPQKWRCRGASWSSIGNSGAGHHSGIVSFAWIKVAVYTFF